MGKMRQGIEARSDWCPWANPRPRFFLGVGPGRCGTLSLARILDQATGVKCYHERYATTNTNELDVQGMIADFAPNNTELVGHIGALWLCFVPLMRMQWRDMPVVCLHREKDEVIRSFLNRQKTRQRRWLLNIAGPTPSVDEEYLERHWNWAEAQMRHIAPPVLHLHVEDLNDNERLDAVYDFLDIAKDCRAYPQERRYHRGNRAAKPEGVYAA